MNKFNRSNTYWLRLLSIGLPVLIITNKVFPFLLKAILNKKLKTIPGFYGQVQGIRSLVEGNAIIIKDFVFEVSTGAENNKAFIFSASAIRIKPDSKLLWKGIAGGEIQIDKPVFSFRTKQQPEHVRNLLQQTLPVHIKNIEINDATLEFIDGLSKPIVEFVAQNLYITAVDLTNLPSEHPLPAQVALNGNAYGGTLKASARINFLKEYPVYDLSMELIKVDMHQLNNIFLAYGGFDVNKGTLDLYTEITARDEKFKGYVEPFIQHLDVVGPQDKGTGLAHLIKENVIGALAEIFENHKTDELATKVPFEGSFTHPKVNTWFAIYETLVNAFVHALKPSVPLKIELNSIKVRAQKTTG